MDVPEIWHVSPFRYNRGNLSMHSMLAAALPVLLTLHGDVEGVHDPSIIRQNSTYYLFSTFGSRESVIALATNSTLDSANSHYKWIDQGPVIRSHNTSDWNAIDPNSVIENSTTMWLAWGSFWSGIKMQRIDPATGKPFAGDSSLYSLAARPQTPEIRGSVEAPFLVRRHGYWFLFVSFDFCCRGAKSTYRVVVGRSRRITGPFLDRDNKPMIDGGGSTVIAATSGQWRGPGHEAVFHDHRRDYLVFHAYRADTGRPSLQIAVITWRDGWPTLPGLESH